MPKWPSIQWPTFPVRQQAFEPHITGKRMPFRLIEHRSQQPPAQHNTRLVPAGCVTGQGTDSLRTTSLANFSQ